MTSEVELKCPACGNADAKEFLYVEDISCERDVERLLPSGTLCVSGLYSTSDWDDGTNPRLFCKKCGGAWSLGDRYDVTTPEGHEQAVRSLAQRLSSELLYELGQWCDTSRLCVDLVGQWTDALLPAIEEIVDSLGDRWGERPQLSFDPQRISYSFDASDLPEEELEDDGT